MVKVLVLLLLAAGYASATSPPKKEVPVVIDEPETSINVKNTSISCDGDPNAIQTSCGNGNCGRLCSNQGKGKGVLCPAVCRAGCNCKPKYVFDENIKKCVLPSQCTPVCKKGEVYNSCTNSGCVPQNCTQLGFPVPCVRLDPKFCIKGCVCAGDNLRSEKDGTCVPRDQCTTPCGGDPNSQPGCGTNCGKRCSDRSNNKTVCTLICNVNGCDCKQGYLFDDVKGKCVLPSKCSVTCNKNEEYSSCVFPNCGSDSCADKDKIYNCPIQNTTSCEGKCVCKPGYRRNNGVCIPEDTCPSSSCNGDPNAYSTGCADNNCGRLCSNYDKGIACIALCRGSGCNCKPNYVFDENTKKCVLPSECTPVCKKDEVYNSCINGGCGPQNCTQLGFPVACVDINPSNCIKGCVCAEGKLRSEKDGTCVPKDQCTTPCGGDPNSKPGCGVNCGKKCSNRNNNQTLPCPKICNINACDCKEGFLYDEATGKCVLPKNCSITCAQNEIYSSCVFPNCDSDSCADKDKKNDCSNELTSNCVGKCICRPGYRRDENGICIPEDSCPYEYSLECISIEENDTVTTGMPVRTSCNGDPNAYPTDCANNNCGRLCSNYNKEVACATVCLGKGCQCKPDYVFDENTNKCVLPSECTPVCKKGEVYNSCTNSGCVPQNCTQLGFPVPCVRIDPAFCIKGCVCEGNNLRSEKDGSCVPRDQCTTSCGGDPNAVSGCGGNCGRRCSNRNSNQAIACPLICNINGCDCKKGYLFDDITGKCVLPKQCSITCKTNEVFNPCPSCGSDKCSDKGKKFFCPLQRPSDCVGKCVCKPGTLRNNDGVCVPEDKCPAPACKENEVYNSCVIEDCSVQKCSQLGFVLPCASQLRLPVDPESCVGACVCRDGYVKDDNDICVPKTECGTCGGDVNAVSGCGGNCNRYCSDLNRNFPVACRRPCDPNGCDCKPGYYFDSSIGKCVLPEQCPPQCNIALNEVPSTCDSVCRPQYCTDLENGFTCDDIQKNNCISTCICKQGYLRDRNGTCVPDYACPRSCNGDINALPGCGINCGRHCSNYKNQDNIVCSDICYENGCDCKLGYVFDDIKNRCVLPKDCTPDIVCNSDRNEEYSDCVNRGCEARECSQLGTCLPCDLIDPSECIKGCICKKGYLRAPNGVCVQESTCNGPCNNDPNAVPGCGVHCGTSCGTYKIRELILCVQVCYEDGCDCKPGYVFDENTRKCVIPEDCSPTCEPNEYYKPCANTGCDPVTCDDLDNPAPCVLFDEDSNCVGGCVCQIGYVRNKDGLCIPRDECPIKQPTCGPNEEYSNCTNGLCRAQNCTQKNYPVACPALAEGSCEKGCVCKENFYRASNGTCVPEDQCENNGCPEGEIYNTCPPVACDAEYCPKSSGDSLASCPTPKQCGKPRCVCGFNSRRDRNSNLCIRTSDCPPFPCDGPNEYYDSCPPVCPGQNCSDYINNSTCPKFGRIGIVVPCKPQCRCEKGFYRDQTGKCVSGNECEYKCKANEVYSDCTNGGCDARNCTQLGTNVPCVKIAASACKKGCVCAAGYLRNADGLCVPKDKCPTVSECKENEVKTGCINGGCRKRNCADINGPILCIDPPLGGCISGCICKTGFLKNSQGVCVPEKQCPGYKCKKPNEIYDKCPNKNDPQTCDSIGQPKPSAPYLASTACIAACRCEPGYYRNGEGDCVPESECFNCGDNEEYSSCVNGGCDRRNCTQLNSPQICIDRTQESCIKGCVCKSGFLKNKAGVCVPEAQCPERKCNKQNEIYDECPNKSDPQTCESIDSQVKSLDVSYECEGQCRCKPNFYRNKLGECISRENCLKCRGPNEYYSCGGACDNVCATIKKQSQKKCPIVNIKCNEMCYCDEGYARDANNICIPISNCTACPKGEVYSTCPPAACDADFCPTSRDSPLSCRSTKECKAPRCVCPYNYRRDRNTTQCIPIKNCPPFPCDGENEVFNACPPACLRKSCTKQITCLSYDIKPECSPSCLCKDNFCRDDSNKCVSKDDY